jgi:hypothetical protein
MNAESSPAMLLARRLRGLCRTFAAWNRPVGHLCESGPADRSRSAATTTNAKRLRAMPSTNARSVRAHPHTDLCYAGRLRGTLPRYRPVGRGDRSSDGRHRQEIRRQGRPGVVRGWLQPAQEHRPDRPAQSGGSGRPSWTPWTRSGTYLAPIEVWLLVNSHREGGEFAAERDGAPTNRTVEYQVIFDQLPQQCFVLDGEPGQIAYRRFGDLFAKFRAFAHRARPS